MSQSYDESRIVSDTLVSGGRADLPDLLGFLYGEAVGAQHILLMTTHHVALRDHYWGELTRGDVLDAMKRGGVSNVFMEFPNSRTTLVQRFQDAAQPDLTGFVSDFIEGPRADSTRDNWYLVDESAVSTRTEAFLQKNVANFLLNAADRGISAYCVAENSFPAAYFEQKALCQGSDTREEDRQPCLDAKTRFYQQVHDDTDRVSRILRHFDGGKSLILGGAAHGSRHDDFEEHLGGRAFKMDFAASYQDYEERYGHELQRLRINVPEFGEDPPDLVYFADKKAFAITGATPPDLVDALKERFDVMPYEKLKESEGQAQETSAEPGLLRRLFGQNAALPVPVVPVALVSAQSDIGVMHMKM